MDLALNEEISLKEQTAVIIFLGHCFTSMEIELVRLQIQKLVSLSMWESLLDSRRNHEFKNIPKWKKFWKAIQKRDGKESDETVKENSKRERWFMRKLIDKFLKSLKIRSTPTERLWIAPICV